MCVYDPYVHIQVLSQMGIAPVPNSRGHKDTDPGPSPGSVSRVGVFGSARVKEGEGEIAVVARILGLVGGAGGAAGGSTGSTVRHGDIRASGTRRTPDAKRKSTIFCFKRPMCNEVE